MKRISRLKIQIILAMMLIISGYASAKNAMHIVINDHLGTPQMLVDENRNVVWKAEYDEFGKANILVEKVEFNLRFPGQYYDKETGLHYNYYRDYDPALGRYVQSDPIGLKGGVNTYGYVRGNPVGYTDSKGLAVDEFWSWPLPYFPTEDEHKNRNKNNVCPCKEPKRDPNWKSGGGKYWNSKGYECAYDSNGKRLPDTDHSNPFWSAKPRNEQNYSYNYSPSKLTPSHVWQDWLPSYVWPDDYPDDQTQDEVDCDECSNN